MKINFTFIGLFITATLTAQIQYTQINQTLSGLGTLAIDVDGDAVSDLNFEILTVGNDELAARVHPQNGTMILDNSTFGYPDALFSDAQIAGNFTYNTGVLGTFTNAGQFNGMGDRYLGIFLNGTHYGWVMLNVSAGRDVILIKTSAYNTTPFEPILAGQTEITIEVYASQKPNISVYPNPSKGRINITTEGLESFTYTIRSTLGAVVAGGQCLSGSSLEQLNGSGLYIIQVRNGRAVWTEPLIVE